jgi:hypothetical protein
MGEQPGLSRRQMIKASAIAGAAAWTAPVIIDSLASPAAAASQQCTFRCSAVYVLYSKGGSVFYAAFQNGHAEKGCNGCKPGPINLCQSTCGNGAFFAGDPSGSCGTTNNLFYNLAGSSCGAGGAGMSQATLDPSCSTNVTLSGDGFKILPGSGVTLLAAFYFTAANWHVAPCPNGSGDIDFAGLCADDCNP